MSNYRNDIAIYSTNQFEGYDVITILTSETVLNMDVPKQNDGPAKFPLS